MKTCPLGVVTARLAAAARALLVANDDVPVRPPIAGDAEFVPTSPEWSVMTLRKFGGTGPPGRYAGAVPMRPTRIAGLEPVDETTGAVGAEYPAGPLTTGAVACQLVTTPPLFSELPGNQ